MNSREKILAGTVGGIIGVLVIGLALRAVVVLPLREMDKKTASLRDRLDKVKAERRAFFQADDAVKKSTQRTFSTEIDQASALSAEMLTQQILKAGLPESDFSRLPSGDRKLRGTREIGWSVQGDGPLERVVSLLYLLEEEPHLHRLDALVLLPGDAPGQVRVRFRYVTLVMEPAPDVELTPLESTASLDSPGRQLYAGIVQRDLLRPYIKRPPPPPVTPGTPPGVPGHPGLPPGAPPGPEVLKVVSLSEWLGQPEVHVRDLVNQKTLRYKLGDPLAGGTIAMVDYRSMPMPGNEALKSFSRVIVKIGAGYWAIERGRTLADKYQLKPEQLPPELIKVAAK